MTTIALFGSSGFIGSRVRKHLEAQGMSVVNLSTPRVTWGRPSPGILPKEAIASLPDGGLLDRLSEVDVVINTAGVTGLKSGRDVLFGANALLPMALAEASQRAGVRRFVHISSSAVQGRGSLDESTRRAPTNVYAASKAWGESLLARVDASATEMIIYRPTSVHGPGRHVTARLRALAHSPLAVVAAPGDDPTPQVHVENVGLGCAFLASTAATPPPIVLHPWEGWTTRTFIRSLAGRDPWFLPRALATGAKRLSVMTSTLSTRLAFESRRLEMLLFGQEQTLGWLAGQDVTWVKRFEDWEGVSDPWLEEH